MDFIRYYLIVCIANGDDIDFHENKLIFRFEILFGIHAINLSLVYSRKWYGFRMIMYRGKSKCLH